MAQNLTITKKETAREKELRETLIVVASNMYASEEIEIDPTAKVSFGEDGAWVHAWVFVPKEDYDSAPDLCKCGNCGFIDDEEGPATCPQCGTVDQWFAVESEEG